ncbi:hypothetical protein NC651_030714 [Populus alba x Populus x berolinensis]|nr:hypothetical protein NC651_030714 [Populus alba x Populus x berolinensis]
MVHLVTTATKTTSKTHVFLARNTMAVGHFKYHGTSTTGQPERATTLMD